MIRTLLRPLSSAHGDLLDGLLIFVGEGGLAGVEAEFAAGDDFLAGADGGDVVLGAIGALHDGGGVAGLVFVGRAGDAERGGGRRSRVRSWIGGRVPSRRRA